MSLDDRLKAVLRREDPPEGFMGRVMSRIRERTTTPLPVTGRRPTLRWVAAGAAASVLIALGSVRYYTVQRSREHGERAKAQVVLALRIASEKLSVVRQKVQDHGEAPAERR